MVIEDSCSSGPVYDDVVWLYFQMASRYDCFFFSSRRRHTRFDCDWSSDVCSSDLQQYRWPGNVRELENLVRRLAALYPQEVIGLEVIEAELVEGPPAEMPAEARGGDRKSVVWGKGVDLGGGGIIKKKKKEYTASQL